VKTIRVPRPRALAAAAMLGMGACLAVAAPALAHAEVGIEPAQAGAADAIVTVFPEAHNHNAGTVSVQVFLPEGIDPGGITLLDGPPGWELTTDDESYTIAGDELAVDTSALHQVRVNQLPFADVIYFRILVTYSDGQVDRWIEVPSEANPQPDHGAPGVELAAAAAPPTTPPAATSPPAQTTSPPAEAAPAADDVGNTGLVITLVVIAAAVAAAVAGLVVVRRRAAGQ
jgi:uncharacterized protein YcnI